MSAPTATEAAEPVDYYAVLELTKGAQDAEIKKAYRRLAMRWHPDKNASQAEVAARKFQEIAEAYDVLMDKEKRAIYDQFGYEGLRDGVVDGHGETRPGYGKPNAQAIFESFFGTANPFADFGYNDALPFGSRLKKPGPKKASPICHDLGLTLEELFNGCTKKLTITRKRYTPEGQLEPSSKVLCISVKPGWKKGTKVTYPCEGDEGQGIIPADVVFTVVEKPHPHFARDGNNLIFTAKVPLVDSLTDCCITVPTLDGRTLSLPCPEVLNPGYQKFIPNEGMPTSKEGGKNKRGELVVRFDVLFPKYISEEKKAKLRTLLAHPAAAH